MTQRRRKLIGAVALLVFLAVYALLAMAAAIILQVNASKAVELIYYVVAGLLWVLPAGFLITWMQRPDPPHSDPQHPPRGEAEKDAAAT